MKLFVKPAMLIYTRAWFGRTSFFLQSTWLRKNSLDRHFEGIIAHATYKISTGRLEGINNKIKTLRRQGYGYPDDDYFFLKLFDASRKVYIRNHTKFRIEPFFGINFGVFVKFWKQMYSDFLLRRKIQFSQKLLFPIHTTIFIGASFEKLPFSIYTIQFYCYTILIGNAWTGGYLPKLNQLRWNLNFGRLYMNWILFFAAASFIVSVINTIYVMLSFYKKDKE